MPLIQGNNIVAPDEDMILIEAANAITKRRGGNTGKPGYVQKDVAYNGNTQYAHGPRGVFNLPGVERDVHSLVARPLGLAAQIPWRPSRFKTPIFETILGLGAESGSEPTDDCQFGPTPGDVKVASQTAPFGKVIRSTPSITMNRVGQLVNNAEPTDLYIVEQLTDPSPFIPDPARDQNILNSEYGLNMWKLGLTMERVVEADIVTGSPASNSGAREYFAGLQTLVNTGKIDLITGSLVPAFDSFLVSWGNASVSGTVTLAGASWDIVTVINALINYLDAKAELYGATPYGLIAYMRRDLFWELTRLWPCSYLTNGCTTAVLNGGTQFVQASEQVAMRDDMRNNMFLWVNGKKLGVVFSDQIPETATANGMASDIYLLPTVASGERVLYGEYFPFNNDMIEEFRSNAALGSFYWNSNSGMYFWTMDKDVYCVRLTAKIEPRIVLRTPWLAARITGIAYRTAIHTLDSSVGGIYSSSQSGGSNIGSYNPAALYPTAY